MRFHYHRWLRIARRLILALLLLLVVGAASAWIASEDVRYVVRAGAQEARILLAREPITKLVGDPATDPSTRGKLSLVLAARDYAADSLGLAANRTFTTFARVRANGDTLVLVLSAARYDKLVEYQWRYPVVGRVPYKGFFRLDQALREARRLELEGMDTYLRPSSAYSTLGWFEDPLLSTVLGEDSVELVATVIHEILHNTIYVPGQTPFDESLASFVGYRGAEAFYRSRGDERNAERAAARWRDELKLGRFYDRLARRLEQLYAPGIAGPQLRAQRQQVFSVALAELAGPVGRTLETVNGRALADRPLNNAVIIAQRFYRTNLDRFDQLLGQGGDLKATIAAVKQSLAAVRDDPWAHLPAADPASSRAGARPRPRATAR